LPAIDVSRRFGKGYHAPDGDLADLPLWRITCFVVDKAHRGGGVSSAALRGALVAMAGRGGGLVEAFPLIEGRASLAHGGYVSMFEHEGFASAGRLDNGSVLMRRVVSRHG
jgi:GNAT superfamily N-acetyltransferase